MGCCQQVPLQEKESQTIGQVSIKQEFSPKAIQMQPFSLNLIKGDNDDIHSLDKMERLGSTCDENALNEKQATKLENQVSLQLKNEVLINIRSISNKPSIVRDSSSKNLNKKFIGML